MRPTYARARAIVRGGRTHGGLFCQIGARARTRELERGLDGLFERWIEVPRIRHGSRQTLETLINEEALLLAKYLREEITKWTPRVAPV